ncbi:hypothetical protein BJP40_06750 [Streptomyces sp. CC53]|uniref:hypothetical protein n=1 Tax=Streptomyces sp. CC53 TaxID=1906740 RepID=UPI0008DE1DB7|nr:hypothetical protein [Streptomyces sp. CC53]OII61220.1 hypothetical protein BJP40_06750 [Streptomyces sp. CC53]
MTAVIGQPWTAAQFNQHVRDNLLETMPGKATAANRLYVTSTTKAIAERAPDSAFLATAATTTSTSYVTLGTGPAVTVTTGSTAVVWFGCQLKNSLTNAQAMAAVAISGATTRDAADADRLLMSGVTADKDNRFGVCRRFTGLSPGSQTFTMQYRVSAGTGTFSRREIVVLPL